MSGAVELARNLSFVEAVTRCKENATHVLRRTDDGRGFSVWSEQPFIQRASAANATKPGSTPSKKDARIYAKPEIEYEPVQCYKCSGRGSSKSGDVCALCGGAGTVTYKPPEIPHSMEGNVVPVLPEQRQGLSQVQIKKILLARSGASSPAPESASEWEFCHLCGGDGGAGGRCPRCGGNGFEPKTTG